MYDTLTDAEFRALYCAARDARAAGRQVVEWQAGDTRSRKEYSLRVSDSSVWAELVAEFRLRFPDQVVRSRNSRTTVSFS